MAAQKFLRVERKASAKVLAVLNQNIIGTPGHGMLYQHTDVIDKLQRIDKPHFVNLMKQEEVIGTCCFCERATLNASCSLKSYYVRYLAFKNAFRRPPVRRRRVTEGNLINEIESILNGKDLDAGEKFFHYAYVDPDNTRSLQLCHALSFRPVREFTTLALSRIKPRATCDLVELGGNQNFLNAWKNFYRGYNMFTDENYHTMRNFGIVDEAGEILAGIQVRTDRWKIHSLQQGVLNLLLHVASATPYLKRVINRDFDFLACEGIFFKQGFEDHILPMIETLLHRFDKNVALIPADVNSELFRVIRKEDLGLTNKLSSNKRIQVICRFNGLSPDETEQFKNSPAYISAFDIT